MITTIYLDMDDVLTDFSNTYHKVIGIDPRTSTPDEWEENWSRWVEGGYFVTQPMLPGANDLLTYIAATAIKTEILSSTGGPDFFEQICDQKRRWLDRWGIHYHPNFTPGKKFKSEFATPHRLLIDDKKSIIKKFQGAGGSIPLAPTIHIEHLGPSLRRRLWCFRLSFELLQVFTLTPCLVPVRGRAAGHVRAGSQPPRHIH